MNRRLIALALTACLLLGATAALIPATAQDRLEFGQSPRAAAIRLSEPDSEGQITLTGDTDAAPSRAYLGIRNLHTGETIVTQAGITGQFFAQLGGTWGTPFLISPAEASFTAANFPGALPGGPGVIVTAPRQTSDPRSFSQQGTLNNAVWTLDAQVNTLTPSADNTLSLNGRITLDRDALAGADSALVCAQVSLMTIAQPEQADSAPRLLAVNALDAQNGWSAMRTVSGAGIVGAPAPLAWAERCVTVQAADPEGNLRLTAPLPIDLPAGLHVPLLALTLTTDGAAISTPIQRMPVVLRFGLTEDQPAHMPVALLLDAPSNGARGVMPEDSPFTLANRVRWNPASYALPPGEYPLAPYVMNMLPNSYDRFAPPLLPLDYTQGSIRVRVTAPDGVQTTLGGPLAQNQVGTALADAAVRYGRQSPVDIFQLASDDLRLEAFAFDQYGPYNIQYETEFADIFGNRYTGGGTVSLLIAETLVLSPAVLSGAPLEAGYPVNGGVHITPAVPAQVDIALVRTGLNGRERIVELSGRANTFGVYSAPPDPFASALASAGEYRLSVSAGYTDTQGRLWHGEWASAGVIVAPEGPLIAHGGRGLLDTRQTQPAPAWYVGSRLAPLIGANADNLIVNMPYFSGGLAFIGADSRDGFMPALSLQDGDGLAGSFSTAALEAGVPQEDVWRGQFPPVGADSYSIVSAVTAGVTVRQFARAGFGTFADDLPLFADSDDPLNAQIGAGFDGLRTGDLVFFFGGAVQRDASTGDAQTAGYAASAMTIVTPPDDPPRDEQGIRVLPPGGESAFMRVGGVEYAAAIVPLGARPGDVLVAGDRFSFAGQIAPALPMQVSITVTAPDGSTQVIGTRANAYGAYALPDHEIIADQPGVWQVHTRATLSDNSAAGALDSAIQGTVVGALDETFSVYVVPDEDALIPWSPALADLAIPAGIPYNLNIVIPGDWSDFSAHRTLGAPGLIIAQGDIRLTGRSLNQQYNPTDINRAYTNIESESRVSGPAASDRVTITLFIQGVDADGAAQIQARVFSFLHDRLISLP
ncbi:MAG: hypothetical protein KME04_12605 [Pleurocapsa minor GSE-CHR-MK-17-07R]|jgi:hypothetical protein|nr:hypothetical protein [Pleurocapsa minor GSE-CHR-MK 17-07R]